MRTSLLFLLLISAQVMNPFNSDAQTSNSIGIIPKPSRIITTKGSLLLKEDVKIFFSEGIEDEKVLLSYLSDQINQLTGVRIPKKITRKLPASNKIIFKKVNDENWGEEEYSLIVDVTGVLIEANSGKGFFYGIQSLLQLVSLNAELKIPYVKILDEPRYSYRGMHLDVCRHFFSVDFIKKYIDLMAMYKMNTFHWHLTEDQGWRIEIKKYPKLTEIGAWRIEKDGSRYGGFYTQDQIKEIVKYAADRFITVIPEIELPGHSVAALSAYPYLACTEGLFNVENEWGVFDDVYCAGKETTFEFLQNVLLEVIDLFPSEYIHIGGDECPKSNWASCPLCQKRIKEEGLKDEHELQSYFIQRIEKFLISKNRKIIGWDEILEGGLAPEATVMSWRGTEGGIQAAKQQHDVIMTPGSHCYFDHYQDENYIEPTAIGGFSPLKKVYEFEPTPSELNEDEAKYILGAQANVWTEYMHTSDRVEYMVAPRICALAEVVWSAKDQRNWADFQLRMNHHYELLHKKEINSFIQAPHGGVNRNFFFDRMKLPLEVKLQNTEIRYTLDGSKPDVNSKIYTEPLVLKNTTSIKTQTFHQSGLKSKIRNIECIKILPLVPDTISELAQGLRYKIIKGKFNNLNELTNDEVMECGVLDKIKFPKDIEEDCYAMEITGFLKIDKKATYTFFNYAVDPVQISIGGHVLINQEGLNSRYERRGRIHLDEGLYPIKIIMVKNTPYANQQVSWCSNYFYQIPINSENLFH
ncbi:family 20 glycosylhydrolase [Labilibaculum antarcticum]|nr:family 20 glycosylhydrolase [Labilibaculum antarcticum]